MTLPPLGVVIVAYDAAEVILDCLASLIGAAAGVPLRVVVVDNACRDGTAQRVQDWAAGRADHALPADLPFAVPPVDRPLPPDLLRLIPAGVNGGFAAGVNIGCAALFADPAVQRVWVLNPDALVPPGTPAALAAHDPGPFALMGGRVTYLDPPDRIQIDGGTLNRRTGVTGNLNLGRSLPDTPPPQAAQMDFVMGASMVVSRAFWDRAGPMAEDYFLYYEEVDWALRRGDLPLAICPAARVYHRAGSAIGSPTLDRPATPFSLYFKHRARMRFVRRHLPRSRPGAWAYTLAKAAHYALRGWRAEAAAVLRGALDRPLPAAAAARLGPAASARAALARVTGDQASPASARALSVASAVRNRP